MKRQVFFLTIIFFVTSCSIFNNKPDGLIADEQLVDILVDIHLADATLSVNGYNVNQDSTKIELLYQDVFNKHSISQQMFLTTINYYSNDPGDLEVIYEQVSEKLAKIESEFDEQHKNLAAEKE